MNVLEVLYNELAKRDDLSIPLTEDEKWEAIRNYRNNLLEQTDWIMIKYQETGEPTPENYLTYRQQLRNIPQDYQTPEEVIFPELGGI